MSDSALTVIYNLPDCAAQRKEGQEGVGQWKILNEGAGLQGDLKGWIIEIKRERGGKIQTAQFHLMRD